MTIIACNTIGISGTTDVHIHENGGVFEARVGIAIMGHTNLTSEELDGADPYSDDFHDNFASGTGSTKEEAIEAMKQSMQSISDSLWY